MKNRTVILEHPQQSVLCPCAGAWAWSPGAELSTQAGQRSLAQFWPLQLYRL